MAELEAFGRTSSHPLVAPKGKWVQTKPAAGTEHTSDRATGKDARPARPAPDGRASPLPALRRLSACRGAPAAPRPSVLLQDAGWPQPQSRAPPACPLSVHPRAGVLWTHMQAARTVQQQRRQHQREKASNPQHVHPPAFRATPQSAPGPAARRHLTEDPRPGTAPSRSCRLPRGLLRPVPRPVTAEPVAEKRAGRVWGPPAAA